MGRLAALVAAVCAVLVFVPAAFAQPRELDDAIGDAGTAADIAHIWVSNDLKGNYRVNTTFATPITQISNYIVYLDLDRNPKTGSSGGAEFFIGYCRGAFLVGRWNGRGWAQSPGQGHAYESIATDHKLLGFTFPEADVGGDDDFDVYAISRRMDASDDEDDAPEGTTNIHYTLSRRVTISESGTAVAPPRAGGYWTVAIKAQRSDTGRPLDGGGRITCAATAGGKQLPVALNTFGPGTRTIGVPEYAVCKFRIAKGLNGHSVRATVTVSYRGTTLRHDFTATVSTGAPAA